MPDRSEDRGQTKCSTWSSMLGVGRGAKDCYGTSREATRGPTHRVVAPVNRRRRRNIVWAVCILLEVGSSWREHSTESSGNFFMADWVSVKFLRRSEPHGVDRGGVSCPEHPVTTELHGVPLETSVVVAHSRNFQRFVKPKSSLACSQEPATGHYPKPD
jgi:hypothetical protein